MYSGIAITLSGYQIRNDNYGISSRCDVAATSAGSYPECYVDRNPSSSGSVLKVILEGATFNAFERITLVLQSFPTPLNAQAALTNVAAGTSNDLYAFSPVIIDATTNGTFPAITRIIANFISLTLQSNEVGLSVAPILVFTPLRSDPISTITLNMPSGYFIGTASFVAGASTEVALTGVSGLASSNSSRIVVTTGGALTGFAQITVTLSGLTLGAAQAAGTFTLSTSSDTDASSTVPAPAIVPATAVTFSSLSLQSNIAGSIVAPVLVFTPAKTVPIGGAITLHMPPGYFVGTAFVDSNASSVVSLKGFASAATSASKTIVITTAGAPTGTSAVTLTLSGLTLGAPQAAGVFELSTSAQSGTQQKVAPSIVTLASSVKALSSTATSVINSKTLRLVFVTNTICSANVLTRSCLLKDTAVFRREISSQCSQLPNNAASATRAVCGVLKPALLANAPANYTSALLDNLATLLGNDLSPVSVCLESRQNGASAMKALLQAISNTESRDPRDPTAAATNLLNLCFSSCRDTSTATLLGATAVRQMPSGPQVFSRFCTDPVMALLWQHANNSPRECSDAMISSLDGSALQSIFGRNVTTCVLRSMLPAYVALCDARTIRCEETMLAIPSAEIVACQDMFVEGKTCSSQCALLANQLSSGDKCFESLWSVQEAVAYAANQTCGDSGVCARS